MALVLAAAVAVAAGTGPLTDADAVEVDGAKFGVIDSDGDPEFELSKQLLHQNPACT
jgi:hypothetical protein